MGQHRPVAARETDRHLKKSHPPSAENEWKATRDQGPGVIVPSLWDDCDSGSFALSGNSLTWTAVPEPGVLTVTAVLSLCGCLIRRRPVSS
jgi:hypothetical protein